ncbi:hypothetical protein [Mesobacillus subterraneus]|uniref:Uncharacterized protein n=1 Tax=Mesobacillus subterraneus TaxID=285983 RepID=A0A0D6ZB00_9BACI|nr:hypothetical protein [Mesobacillus subterraneus]KIY22515.1 hypothetical protein UB32_08255 [Mesobacillus subterraneus]
MINNSLIKFLFILTIIVSVFLIGNSTLASTEKVPNFSEQIEFRKEFGLEANHTKVELLNLEGKLLQNSKFQVPLTIEEEEELEKRFALQNEEVPKVKKFLDDK